MIILTAGHTGAGTGAQCATTQFDEGAETIWLRDRIAEILTNKYGLVVLVDNDTASLQLLTKQLSATPSGFDGGGDTPTGGLHPRLCSVTPSAFDFLIDTSDTVFAEIQIVVSIKHTTHIVRHNTTLVMPDSFRTRFIEQT